MIDTLTNLEAPKDAATVMVLRDTPEGLEVFMTRRAPTMAFAPDAMVFPGGKVDEEDNFNAEEGELRPFQNAVVREAFEEVGLLLAYKHDEALSANEWKNLQQHRDAIVGRQISFDAFMQENRLTPNYKALTYVSRWITPPRLPKRFDTRFFIAQMPEGQYLEHDGSEAVSSQWLKPKTLLDRSAAGKEAMLPPTFWMLSDLSQFYSAKDAIRGMQIAHFEPDLRNNQA